MVLLSLSSRFNKVAGSFLLRRGLSARYILGGGIIRDNPFLDKLLLLPLAQKLISLEVKEDALRAMIKASKAPSTVDVYVNAIFDTFFGDDHEEQKNKKFMNQKHPHATNLRLEALEKLLRPVLVPNERWLDVRRWQFNTRFIKWARSQFLIARHGHALSEALQLYSKLRDGPSYVSNKRKSFVANMLRRGSVSTNNNNNGTDRSPNTQKQQQSRMILPSITMIEKALDMKKWSRQKNPDADWRHMTVIANDLGGQVIKVPGCSIRCADVPPDTDLSLLSLEDLLEIAGGHVKSRGPFNALCEEGDVYEFWTKEYVAGLASYILDRSEGFTTGPTIVLDIGAGDGILSHFLREWMEVELQRRLWQKEGSRKSKASSRKLSEEERSKIPDVIATDDGSWNIDPQAPIENLGVSEALAKYAKPGGDESKRQLLVLCSWMPMGTDWTKDFRAGNVDEYILIGECDDGNCGDNWNTWGNKEFLDDDDELVGTGQADHLPSTLSSFRRKNLEELSKLQFSRFDSALSSNSNTVSFRRRKTIQR